MTADDYVTRIQVVNERDPVPSKGVFHFTPDSGQAYVAFQARMNHGTSEVSATAECNHHGRWSSRAPIRIPEGAGGCAAAATPPGAEAPDAILPPRIRLPALLKRGRLRPDEIVDVQLEIRHPNRTGLVLRDGEFVQASEPFHLRTLDVFYGDERVSWFALTPALSDNPLITFRLRASREGPIHVVLENSRGQRFEATHPIRFA